MDIYAVAGGDGAGKTTTALNAAVAFRAAGRYAAVLDADASGNVTGLLDLDPEHTLEDVIEGGASVREATIEHELAPATVPEAELVAYREAMADDRRAFRSGETSAAGVAETEFPDVTEIPVIPGWPSERRLASASAAALEDVLQELVMAYDAIVVDTGGESIAATAPVAVADGVAIVTTPDETHVQTATQTARECQRNGAPLVGTVVNRAGDEVSVGGLTDQVGMEAVGVIPADARTPGLEPVRYGVPDSPTAAAYDRLADNLADWHRTVEEEASSVTDGGGPDPDSGRPPTTDEAPEPDESDDEDDGGGFMSGLRERFG
jgi:MinD-like ATPase involved in chromosome partitioning or flagellar assembly